MSLVEELFYYSDKQLNTHVNTTKHRRSGRRPSMADVGKAERENFTNRRNQRLHRREWKFNAHVPKGLIFICHGYGEHSGCYEDVAANFKHSNCYLFAHDHACHGLSEGTQVHFNDLNPFVDDVFDHIEEMKERYPNVPVFIIGHSMGGLIAALLTARQPNLLRGMVLISPCFGVDPKFNGSLTKFIGRVAAWMIPSCPTPGTKIQSHVLSHDEEVCQKYDADPLVWHGAIKLCSVMAIMSAIDELTRVESSITTPYLLQHGTLDELCDLEGSRRFHKNASSQDSQMLEYENLKHQIHHETVDHCLKVHNDFTKWILDRV